MEIINHKKRNKKSGKNKSVQLWPHLRIDIKEEPHFLFVIALPYSGTTALAQVLNSANGSMLLQFRGEGQWLVPGMREDRWNPDKFIDWESVRSVWLQRVALVRSLVQDIDVVIEKSPPNLVRVDGLKKTFPNHSLMAFNRNPFASCSSILHRRSDIAGKTVPERIKLLRNLASKWLERSHWVRMWAQRDDVIDTTYEAFCADPAGVIERLAVNAPALKTVDVDKPVKVKDYEKQKLQNQNARQIGNLSDEEIEAISKVLSRDGDLVRFFGYDPDAAN